MKDVLGTNAGVDALNFHKTLTGKIGFNLLKMGFIEKNKISNAQNYLRKKYRNAALSLMQLIFDLDAPDTHR